MGGGRGQADVWEKALCFGQHHPWAVLHNKSGTPDALWAPICIMALPGGWAEREAELRQKVQELEKQLAAKEQAVKAANSRADAETHEHRQTLLQLQRARAVQAQLLSSLEASSGVLLPSATILGPGQTAHGAQELWEQLPADVNVSDVSSSRYVRDEVRAAL